MKPQVATGEKCITGRKKVNSMLWNLSSELIGVYLWFLKFSNVLLKLVQ